MPTTRLVALAALLCAGAAGTGTSAAGEPGLETRVDALERRFTAELRQAEDRMAGELTEMKGELERMGARLDSCEAETATFGQAVAVIESKRRLQDEARCQGAEMQAMLSACCSGGGGGGGGGGQHRRELQGGCSGFPASCSVECAALFGPYYESCQAIIVAMPAGRKAEFDSYYGRCSEAGQGAAAMMQPVQVQMYRIRLSTEAGQGQTAGPQAGTEACWSGVYTADRCCALANGPTGDSSCWAGSFDFEFCCPAITSPASVRPIATHPTAPPTTLSHRANSAVCVFFQPAFSSTYYNYIRRVLLFCHSFYIHNYTFLLLVYTFILYTLYTIIYVHQFPVLCSLFLRQLMTLARRVCLKLLRAARRNPAALFFSSATRGTAMQRGEWGACRSSFLRCVRPADARCRARRRSRRSRSRAAARSRWPGSHSHLQLLPRSLAPAAGLSLGL